MLSLFPSTIDISRYNYRTDSFSTQLLLAVAVALPLNVPATLPQNNIVHMQNFHAGWYLIYTRPRHEKKVHERLREININSFLPLTKKLRTWHDRKKYVDEPLFPSYVFIYLKDLQNYYEGMDADGSLYYVRSGKKIAMVQESVVNSIKLVSEKVRDPEISQTRFQPGTKVVITQGALTGLSCEVIQFDNIKKLLVRVELLQRNILLTVPAENLAAL